MVIDLGDAAIVTRAHEARWRTPKQYWGDLTSAIRDLPAPLVAVQLDALRANAQDMSRRAGGLPIRIASKSIRVRDILEAVLQLPGYRGILAYSLNEANWLATFFDDIVVAYPSVDQAAITQLVTNEQLAKRVTIMIDSVEHLDAVDAVLPADKRERVRVCLDFDASWHAPLLGNVGVFRSPLHSPAALRSLAEQVTEREGFDLVGIMAYEAQIAGVGNAPQGNPLKGKLLRAIQKRSASELHDRRGEAVQLVREVAALEFVNGGGTGSIESTAADAQVTEIGAGSGLFGPHLFDHYAHFTPAPAVAFALDVVRKATPDTATLFGGGWIASGVPGADRTPQVAWPQNLSFISREGAGEVQTPLTGADARDLQIGDRVWLRHTKSGEIMEHVNEVALVSGDTYVGAAQTYRGEGKVFV